MKLTKNEIENLIEASRIADESSHQIYRMVCEAKDGVDIDEHRLWELKNYSRQISAVLFNIHDRVYRISKEAI